MKTKLISLLFTVASYANLFCMEMGDKFEEKNKAEETNTNNSGENYLEKLPAEILFKEILEKIVGEKLINSVMELDQLKEIQSDVSSIKRLNKNLKKIVDKLNSNQVISKISAKIKIFETLQKHLGPKKISI